MKKFLILILLISCFTLTSCKPKYKITENAMLLESGNLSKFGFYYEDIILYDLPEHSYVVKLKEGFKKGAITIYKKTFDKFHNVIGYVANRTIVLKENKTYMIYLYDANYYDDETKEIVNVNGEVIAISSGISIYIDSTK